MRRLLTKLVAIVAVVMPVLTAAQIQYRYWFDYIKSPESAITGTTYTDSFHIELDASGLSPNMHLLNFQIQDADGLWGSHMHAVFCKVDNEVTGSAKCADIYIDGTLFRHIDELNGAADFTLNVASLPVGLHTACTIVTDTKGYRYPSANVLFYKPSFEDFSITKYRYWLNRDDSSANVVEVNPPADNLQLISLVELPQMPFSSHSFTCSPSSDGGLDLYALNTVHWLFYSGESVNTSYEERTFSDLRCHVKIPKGEIDTLRHTMSSDITLSGINNNNIKWLSVESQVGTMLTWRTDCSCEVDLFDKNGRHLVDLEGQRTITDSTYIFSDAGTYYMAVHDPTRNASELNLHYTLLNRNDIVDCKPDICTPGSTVFVDIKGNSLEKVSSIALKKEETEIIASAISRFDTNNARVRFDLTDSEMPKGSYDIVATFSSSDNNAGNTVTLPRAISVEELRLSDVTVTLDAVPRVENPYHFSVIVNNTGNETLWGVPFNLAFEHKEAIDSLTTENFALAIDSDMHDAGAKTSYFTENLLGTGNPGTFVPMLIDVLTPGIHEYRFSLSGHAPSSFRFYAWTGVPWSKSEGWEPSNDNLMTWNQMRTDLEVEEDKAEDIFNEIREWIFDSYMGENSMPVVSNLSEEHPNKDSRVIKSLCVSLPAMRIKIKIIYPGDKKKEAEKSNSDGSKKSNNPPTTPTPSTPPSPPAPPAPSGPTFNLTFSFSFDPNDIRGYVSPSGSNDIGINTGALPYIIEFENDPAFANAPASMIRLRSYLDPNIFDTSSFTPRSIKVGRSKAEWTASSRALSLDMRPYIDAIAQAVIDFNAESGVLDILLTSHDPMTMEQTNLVTQGILPVNSDGEEGLGEFAYTIMLKNEIASDTRVENSAEITFDFNPSIKTPVWTNVTDFIRPVSRVSNIDVDQSSDTATITVEAYDEGSGVWEYELYRRIEPNDYWEHVGEINNSGVFSVPISDAHYQFCSYARDMAGNTEDKSLTPEMEIDNYIVKIPAQTGIGAEIIVKESGDGIIFDLLGRKVDNPSMGIYIRNNRKIFIR